MFKKIVVILCLAICSISTAFAADSNARIFQISDGVRFSESVYPYDGGLLISNFGSENFTPRDDENKGYISYYKNGEMTTIVPPYGSLHCPTAMAVKDDYLFVCDKTDLKVFNLNNLNEEYQIVTFPTDDKVINAMALKNNTLYITMTNPGRVYQLDVSEPANMTAKTPEKWLDIPGANGIAIRDNTMYVVSIPTDYATITPKNVIYRIKNINRPIVEKFDDIAALYDGVDISNDGKKLYVSDWKSAALIEVDIRTKEHKIIYQKNGIGPADLAIENNIIYLPDLLNSKILVMVKN